MTTILTSDILDVICVVQSYIKFLRDEKHIQKDFQRDVHEMAYKYFVALDLPKGMNRSKSCYMAVLNYDITPTLTVQEEELSRFTFSF